MNLYLISQEENQSYDTYDSAVVAAESESEARTIDPANSDYYEWDTESESWQFVYHDGTKIKQKRGDWANRLENIKVTLLGKADPSIKKGVVCASFNAG